MPTSDIFQDLNPLHLVCTLGSSFDWFPRPLDIFIVHVTMYLRHTICHQVVVITAILHWHTRRTAQASCM